MNNFSVENRNNKKKLEEINLRIANAIELSERDLSDENFLDIEVAILKPIVNVDHYIKCVDILIKANILERRHKYFIFLFVILF